MSPSTIPNDDSTEPELSVESAQFVYEAQVQQIDRSATNAEGLLTALALLAAFSSPLVLEQTGPGLIRLLFGAGLVTLFGSLSAAAYWTLRVMYVGRSRHRQLKSSQVGEGWVYFGDIVRFETSDEYASHCSSLTDSGRASHLYQQAWQLAFVVQSKSRATVAAVRWTLVSLVMFLGVLVIRYLDATL